jgi:hypothetical protein
MKLILEYKEFTTQTKKVEIVKHWLDYYLKEAYNKWTFSLPNNLNVKERQEKFENEFWEKFGLGAINLVLGRISYKNKGIDIELDKKNDLYSLIDVNDKERILFFAKKIFNECKTQDYTNCLNLFKEKFLDKINRNYLSQEGFN